MKGVVELPTLRDVRFSYDSAKLTELADDKLARVAAWMRAHPNKRIELSGHTDPHGSKTYNRGLGMDRALSVTSALVARGLDPERIRIVTYGESRPESDADTKRAYQRSRRVEFHPLS